MFVELVIDIVYKCNVGTLLHLINIDDESCILLQHRKKETCSDR